jgi:RNA polymerase sigma-70 factor (ECF subfamily)
VVSGGRDELAREVLQQAFLRAVRHIRMFESESACWSWLTVLARTAFVDEFRRDSRRVNFLERWFSTVSQGSAVPSPVGDPEAHLRELMEAGLAELTPDERALLERKYFEGDSVREIAAAEGLTEKATEARLGRARQKLRALVTAQLRHEAPE